MTECQWRWRHLPHLKPMLVGCHYRPSSAKNVNLDNTCEMLDLTCDFSYEIYFEEDLKIEENALKREKQIKICHMHVGSHKLPTRLLTLLNDATQTSTCIAAKLCSKMIHTYWL